MSELRTLPIRLAPLPGESLDSWMEALADRSMVDLREILLALGLHHRDRGLIADHTLFLQPQEAEQASFASGVPVGQLHLMTLRQYDGHAVILHPERRTVLRMQLWGRSTGSRYCPECLREREGRWLLRWRLAWAFACTRHHLLLAHDCPSCGRRPRHGKITAFRNVPPNQCSAALQHSGPFCRTDLSLAPACQLAEGSPVLAAQKWIDSLLSGAENNHDDPDQQIRTTFEDLRALASWFRRRAAPGDFEAFGEHIEEANQRDQSDGQFTPVSAAVAAGCLTRASTVLLNLAHDHSVAVIRDLLDRDAEHVGTTTTPGEVHNRWKRHSTELQQTVWRAMDGRMSTIERLRYRSCAPQPRPPLRDEEIIKERAGRVPQLLWRSWALRFLPEAGRRVVSFRPALSVTLLLPGWPLRSFDPLTRMLHDQEQPNVHYALLKVIQTNEAALATLCSLADYLDDDRCPIDYARRRATVSSDLLPTSTRLDICADTNTPPGGAARELVMRRYVYQRLTGNHHRQAPGPLQTTTSVEEALLAAFPFTLTASLLEALDDYAVGYLRAKGIEEEPLVWEPPAHLGLSLPWSQEVDDGHVEQAHRLICEEGIQPLLAATQMGVPLEYLRIIFETRPPQKRARATGREGSSPQSRLASARARRRAQKELTDEFLLREYLTEKKSIDQIGAEAQIPVFLIRERIGRTGLLTLRHPGRKQIDEHWLRKQYLHHARSLAEIAEELGTSSSHVGRHARAAGIELRPRGARAASLTLLEKVPPFLRPAVTDRHGWGRLLRFREAMQHRTIAEAARHVGTSQAVVSAQVTRLERDLGTVLYVRPRPGRSLRPTQAGYEVLEALTDIEAPRK